ncbi:Fc.00g069610.m01.CDS01 [Cosmosporella sp. VM-42]
MEKTIDDQQQSSRQGSPLEKGVIIDSHADIGLKYLIENGTIEFTPQEERRVRWKIDLYFLPILAISFGLQYLDKVTISYAAIYGMREELNLVGQQYSWANSLFYFGYLVGEFPANYLMHKVPIGKFAAVNTLIWGVLVMLCAVAKDFAGLAVLRFLMGLFEACIGPCWVQLTGMFYKAGEQGARVAIWYSMVGFAAIIGGLMSYGIGHINSINVAEWQFIFLVCGGFTVLWSAIIWFFLPESPADAKFLSHREKSIAVERLRSNRTGLKSTVFKWSQALEALKDPQCWMIAFWTGMGNVLNIGGSFLPLIIKDMGFTGLATTLLTLPVGGVEIVAMGIAAILSSSFSPNGRTPIMFFVASPTLAGTIILFVLPQSATWGRCAGVWLLLCIPAAYALLLSLISSNVAGTSKKATTMLMVFVFFCVGNIVSPQLFIATEAPRYGTALRSLVVCAVLVQALTIALGLYYHFENKRRDSLVANMTEDELAGNTVENEEFLDRTDREDWVRFRYRF